MNRPIETFVAGNLEAQRHPRLSHATLRRLASVFGLALSDILAFAIASIIFNTGHVVPTFQFLYAPANFSLDRSIDVFIVIAMVFVVVRYLAGDYSRRQLFWDEARVTTVALIVAAVPDLVLTLMTVGTAGVIGEVAKWATLIVAVPMLRQLTRYVLAKVGLWKLSTALVGSGQAALDAFQTFSSSLSLGFDVQYLIVDEIKGDVPPALRDLSRISLRDPSNIIARLWGVGCQEVVIASEDVEREHLDTLIHHLIAAHIGVAIIPALGKLPLSGLSTNYFFGRNLLLLQVRNNLSRLPGRMLKRAIDFFGSLVLLILLSPVLAVIMALIKRSNEGPALFVQPRVGLDGQEFKCIKFRTMAIDAEDQLMRWKRENPALYQEYVESNFKLRNDPRVTSVGRWLRRTSLDELPQLVNVFRGQMSLVGPRPLLSREISEYGIGFELYRCVRPGITGLWQISGRSETRFCDRVAFDEWYIKNWSIWYDIVILLKTAGALARSRGAY